MAEASIKDNEDDSLKVAMSKLDKLCRENKLLGYKLDGIILEIDNLILQEPKPNLEVQTTEDPLLIQLLKTKDQINQYSSDLDRVKNETFRNHPKLYKLNKEVCDLESKLERLEVKYTTKSAFPIINPQILELESIKSKQSRMFGILKEDKIALKNLKSSFKILDQRNLEASEQRLKHQGMQEELKSDIEYLLEKNKGLDGIRKREEVNWVRALEMAEERINSQQEENRKLEQELKERRRECRANVLKAKSGGRSKSKK